MNTMTPLPPPALAKPSALPDVSATQTSTQYDPDARSLCARWQPLLAWQATRIGAGLHPQGRIAMARTATKMMALDPAGRPVSGINFASQDYLSLSQHHGLLAAATAALGWCGLHASGTAPLMGLSTPLIALETRVAQFLRLPEAAVFPSGAEANRAAIRTLIRAGDHVLIDAAAHSAFFDASRAITRNLHRMPPGSTEAAERRLRRIRRENPKAAILVVTSGIAAFSANIPDLAALADLCREHGATLLVDVAHDLGAMGPTGRGVLELQGMLARVDVVTGSFAKCFGSNGGFVAARDPALKPALRFSRGGQGGSSALSPMQAAMVLAAFDIIDSHDGAVRRQRLLANVLRLRNHLMADGFVLMGRSAPIVPVRLETLSIARKMTAAIETAGALVTLLENPAVAGHAPRWRLQLMADHSTAEIDQFAALARALRPQSPSPRAAKSRAKPLTAPANP